MAVVTPHKAIKQVASADDPKRAIIETIGSLVGVRIPGDRVLVATYFRPEKTVGGIIRPDVNVQEDLWQGKVGLVMMFGSKAFKDATDYSFDADDIPSIHDWAVYHVGDAKMIQINGYPCRLVRDVDLCMFIDDPNRVF